MKAYTILITWSEADAAMPACYSVVLYKQGDDDHIGDAYPDDLGGDTAEECESSIAYLCDENGIDRDDVDIEYDV